MQLVKKFPAFHGTRRFITALTNVRHLSLSWASPIQSIYPHPTSWRSIVILSTHLRLGLPTGSFPPVSPPRPYTTPLLTHTHHMPRYKLKDIYNLVLTNIFFTTYSTLSHYFFTSINYWDQKSIFWKVVLHVITHLQKYYIYIYIYIYICTCLTYLRPRFPNLVSVLHFYLNRNDSWRGVSLVRHYAISYFSRI